MKLPKTIGRYQIVSEIGRGAMGVVYKATDPTIGRTVALKTMRVDVHGADEEEILHRFRHEAKLAGLMSHPSIVTVFDAGEDEGVFFMAMEFIEGVTLQSMLKKQRRLPLERVIEIARHIGAGLDYAHDHSVIHRDVKPANIMCAHNGAVKIMDFGIAKSGAGVTSAGQVLGTPTYMSPEQVRGKTLDGRSDLFSFGVILYEMVTGEKPFTGQNVTAIIYKIMNDPAVPARELDVTIHPGISAVIERALAKKPEDRYQKGVELVRDLENYRSYGAVAESTSKFAAAGAGGEAASLPQKNDAVEREGQDGQSQDSSAASPILSDAEHDTQKMPGSLGAPGVETRKTGSVESPAGVPAAVPEDRKRMRQQKLLLAGASVAVLVTLIGGYELRSSRHPSGSTSVSSAPSGPPAAASPTALAATVLSASTEPSKTAIDKPSPVKATSPPLKVGGKLGAAIVVKSTPAGAAIWVDKKDTGKVTPAQLKVESGRHEVALRKDGFRDANSMPTLKEGETYRFAPTMEEQKKGGNPFRAIKGFFGGGEKIPQGKGLARIKTDPPGAEVSYKGGSPDMTTPVKLPLDPSAYKVRIKLDGYRPESREFTIVKGKTTDLNIALTPK